MDRGPRDQLVAVAECIDVKGARIDHRQNNLIGESVVEGIRGTVSRGQMVGIETACDGVGLVHLVTLVIESPILVPIQFQIAVVIIGPGHLQSQHLAEVGCGYTGPVAGDQSSVGIIAVIETARHKRLVRVVGRDDQIHERSVDAVAQGLEAATVVHFHPPLQRTVAQRIGQALQVDRGAGAVLARGGVIFPVVVAVDDENSVVEKFVIVDVGPAELDGTVTQILNLPGGAVGNRILGGRRQGGVRVEIDAVDYRVERVNTALAGESSIGHLKVVRQGVVEGDIVGTEVECVGVAIRAGQFHRRDRGDSARQTHRNGHFLRTIRLDTMVDGRIKEQSGNIPLVGGKGNGVRPATVENQVKTVSVVGFNLIAIGIGAAVHQNTDRHSGGCVLGAAGFVHGLPARTVHDDESIEIGRGGGGIDCGPVEEI